MLSVRFLKTTCVLILVILVANFARGQSDPNLNESPKIIVGTEHIPPFAIKNPDGSWDGISIEIWRQITTDLNRKYELRVLTLEGLLDSPLREPINRILAENISQPEWQDVLQRYLGE